MTNSFSLLMLDDANKRKDRKLVRSKEIYQLQNIDDDHYTLKPFKMLVYNGNFNNYLAENRISLCYVINDNDLEINLLYGDLIQKYDADSNGQLIKQENISTKRLEKGFQ